MFKIYFVNSAYEKDQVLMYDDTRDDDGLKLGNPKLHIEVNAAGTLDFELPSTNVAYSRIIPMVTELHVIKDNQKTHDKHIWFGRVLTIDTDLYGTKTIHCEGGLAYLNDCIYYDKSVDHGSWSNQKTVGRAIFARYESPTLNEGGVHVYGVSPNEASAVIANIMSGGSNYKENLNAPFKHLGRIAKDTDSDVPIYAWVNEPVVPSGDQTDDDYYFDEDNLKYAVQNQCGISNPNNMTAIDLISSMMSNVGGLFWVSKTPQYPKRTFGGANSGDAVYVMQLHMRRYYPSFNPDEGQTIQIEENLTDLTITDDGTTFFTAVHPHGQHVNSGEDFTLDHRGSQGGTTYVNKRNWKIDPDHGVMYCPELVKQYGMIIRDLDVGTSNIYEQLIGMGISEIDRIPIISKTVGGSWTSGVRELTVKGIDMSLYNADYSSIELTDAVRVLAPRHGIDTYLNVTAIDYDLQNVENTVFTLNAIKSSNEITNASPSYGSNSVPQSSGSSYVHPKHTEHDLGLYKFSNDNLGHVNSAVAVTKKDITALGIPDKDTNTTYKLSKYGNTIKMTGSDGTTYTVVDSDTVYIHPKFAEYANGLYKIAVNGEGHVTNAKAVTKKDITALGIPDKDTNTTYKLVQDGIAINMLGSDGSSSEVGLKPTITKKLYGWINHELNTDDTGKIIIDTYLGASPVRWDSVLTEPTKVEVGYDVSGQAKTLITDFANDILVHNVVSQNCSTTVTGKWNLVEGNYNTIYGNNNLVGGEYNLITEHGYSSIVSGYGLYCDAVNQTVLGRYNAKDTGTVDSGWHSYYGKYVLIIGNGFDSDKGRSNAFAVDWDGNLWCGKDKTSLNAQVASKQDKLTAGTNITISGSTISAKDTTYTSKSAVSGGTDVSLVTTGEKAIWNAKTSNVGTITGIKMNGASKGTSGVVDLGTVITAHQDISGKQDKSTAVTHGANTAVGSATKPVYVAANGIATPISHSINSDVPANAKFTDTTYNDATQSAHGLMTAADKKKLDGIAAGATKVAVDSALSATSTNPVQNKAVKAALDSKSASGHTHAMITNSMLKISGSNNAAKWVCLGTLVSGGDAISALIRVWSGNGFNAGAYQNASFEIQIKDGYQSTPSADRACGVTVYRINCSAAKVKVIPTKHNTYTVWVYLPWAYWNGNYAVYGRYTSWTYKGSNQTAEPEGTAADIAYYDQAFLTSTVANATTWNGLINDVDTYNSSDTWILVKKDNRIQHRYAGELDVNSAKTLVDSGWSSVTTYIVDKSKFNNISTEFRRIGQIAWVKCSFTPNVAMTNITICDVVNVDPFVAVTPANTVFGVGSASDGSESFIASISYNPDRKLRLRGNFKPSTIYRLMFSYPVT